MNAKPKPQAAQNQAPAKILDDGTRSLFDYGFINAIDIAFLFLVGFGLVACILAALMLLAGKLSNSYLAVAGVFTIVAYLTWAIVLAFRCMSFVIGLHMKFDTVPRKAAVELQNMVNSGVVSSEPEPIEGDYSTPPGAQSGKQD